nr:ankyrin repeat domain-containing protein 2-like isoform X3 [Penaeus vannamei]
MSPSRCLRVGQRCVAAFCAKMALVRAGDAEGLRAALAALAADARADFLRDNTALHFAARNGHLSVVQFLAEKGGDLNARDWLEWTALHFAARNGHLSVVQFLAENGGDLNARDCNEWTALHFAARNGHLSVVQFLAEKGGDLNARDRDDETALHFAARNGHLSVVQFLAEKGGDLNARSRLGQHRCIGQVGVDIGGHWKLSRRAGPTWTPSAIRATRLSTTQLQMGSFWRWAP